MMFKTKILILGPRETGKSTIANFLADATQTIGGSYRPTQGVRIVEFESNSLQLNGKNVDAEVELWDCSGDKKFEKCWPAIQRDANGVILVCNPDKPAQLQELEQWYVGDRSEHRHTNFVTLRGITPSHVIVFVHIKSPESTGDASSVQLPRPMASLQKITTNIETDGDALRLEFNNFLCSVISGLSLTSSNKT